MKEFVRFLRFRFDRRHSLPRGAYWLRGLDGIWGWTTLFRITDKEMFCRGGRERRVYASTLVA